MSTIFIINFNVNPNNISQFGQIMQSVLTDLPKINGCNGVQIFQNASQENNFTLVENWQSEQTHQSHIQNLTSNGEWDKIAELLAAEPVGHYFNQLK